MADDAPQGDAPVPPAAQGFYSALRAAVTRRMDTGELRSALGAAARREERLARRVAALEAALAEAGEEVTSAVMRAAEAEAEAAGARAQLRLLQAGAIGGRFGGAGSAVGRSGTGTDGPGAVRARTMGGSRGVKTVGSADAGTGDEYVGAGGSGNKGVGVTMAQLFGRCAPGYGTRLSDAAGGDAAAGAVVAAGAATSMQVGFVADKRGI